MNTSKIFKNAILNLYKQRIYTVDFAILKACELAEKNKINAEDYEELLTYLATEQEKSMKVEVIEEIPVEEVQEEVVENIEEVTTEEYKDSEDM